jgi:hypothetical protein
MAERGRLTLNDGVVLISADADPRVDGISNVALGSICFYNGALFYKVAAATTGWVQGARRDPDQGLHLLFDDFVTNSTAGVLGWTLTSNGAAATGQLSTTGVNTTERAQGVIELDTGTNNAGRTGLHTSTTGLLLGYTDNYFEFRSTVDVNPDGTQSYGVQFGVGDQFNTTNANATNGVYFAFSNAAATYQCITAAGGSLTTTSTATNIFTATEFHKFGINILDGTSVVFSIDGTVVATHTTNLPTALTGLGARIFKTAGTTSRSLFLDYVSWQYSYPTVR